MSLRETARDVWTLVEDLPPYLAVLVVLVLLWQWIRRLLGLDECNYPGCDADRVRRYNYCLDHGAGLRGN